MTGTWTIDRIRLRCKEDENGCWIWQQALAKKGGMPVASINGAKSVGVRRFVFEQANGRIIGGTKWRIVCGPQCDRIECCNPAHLVRVSAGTVIKRQWADGLREATRHPTSARLTREIADKIRVDTRNAREVAAEWGITPEHVRGIRRGRAWAPQPPRIASVWDLGRTA